MGYALRRIRLLCWGGKFAVEGVAMLPWNRRQVCYGISGKFGVELVATFIWNWWQLSHGIRTRPSVLWRVGWSALGWKLLSNLIESWQAKRARRADSPLLSDDAPAQPAGPCA